MTEQACPTCGRGPTALEEMLVEARQQLQDLDREFRQAIREKGRLRAELSKQRGDAPQAQDARRVFDHWVDRMGKNANVVFGPAREKAVQARLREFSVEVVLKAVDGCALMSWVGPHGRQAAPGKGAKRHDELALICRDETTVERFASYIDQAEEAKRPKLDGPVEPADRYGTTDGQVRWHGTAVNPDWSVTPGGLELVMERLGQNDCVVRGSGAKYAAQCPAHDDRDPSLSIFEKPDGRVLLHCHAGCRTFDVLAALGLEFADIGGACALSPDAVQRVFGSAA